MRFYVCRSGWNKANQESSYCPQRMRVATVEAEAPEAACKLAAARITVYNNQHLDAEDADQADAREAAVDEAVQLDGE